MKVDGSGVTQPVSGSVSVSNFPATQPVSASSLPLPTGAATGTKQDTGNTSLSSIDTKLPAKGQAAMAASTPVVIASDQSTVPVSAASLPLPTGAATGAKQDTGNTSVASIDTKIPALGQALAAASVPVVLPAAQITTLTPPTTITANQGSNNATPWNIQGAKTNNNAAPGATNFGTLPVLTTAGVVQRQLVFVRGFTASDNHLT
jgi:hypothetical protein